MDKTTTIDPAAVRDRVASLPNIAEFAKRTGLPLRTLERIKASAQPGAKPYRPNTVTLLAIAAALAKPQKKRRARKADAEKAGQ
jgi:hypothetical protein